MKCTLKHRYNNINVDGGIDKNSTRTSLRVTWDETKAAANSEHLHNPSWYYINSENQIIFPISLSDKN